MLENELLIHKEYLTMALTKKQIIEEVSRKNGFTMKKSTETIEILLEIMKRSLESGEDVMISGFGKFCIKDKKERKGRNPSTGEDLMLEPRKVVTFRCSQKLRDRVNGQ